MAFTRVDNKCHDRLFVVSSSSANLSLPFFIPYRQWQPRCLLANIEINKSNKVVPYDILSIRIIEGFIFYSLL